MFIVTEYAALRRAIDKLNWARGLKYISSVVNQNITVDPNPFPNCEAR